MVNDRLLISKEEKSVGKLANNRKKRLCFWESQHFHGGDKENVNTEEGNKNVGVFGVGGNCWSWRK